MRQQVICVRIVILKRIKSETSKRGRRRSRRINNMNLAFEILFDLPLVTNPRMLKNSFWWWMYSEWWIELASAMDKSWSFDWAIQSSSVRIHFIWSTWQRIVAQFRLNWIVWEYHERNVCARTFLYVAQVKIFLFWHRKASISNHCNYCRIFILYRLLIYFPIHSFRFSNYFHITEIQMILLKRSKWNNNNIHTHIKYTIINLH